MSEGRKYSDRREYLIAAVKKRRQLLRKKAVDFLGGKCTLCGYQKDITVLDFHHIDEKTKEFGLSERGLTRSWLKIEAELNKCILVCANCHREIHSGMRIVDTFAIQKQPHLL